MMRPIRMKSLTTLMRQTIQIRITWVTLTPAMIPLLILPWMIHLTAPLPMEVRIMTVLPIQMKASFRITPEREQMTAPVKIHLPNSKV